LTDTVRNVVVSIKIAFAIVDIVTDYSVKMLTFGCLHVKKVDVVTDSIRTVTLSVTIFVTIVIIVF